MNAVKLLADECLARGIVVALEAGGFDVIGCKSGLKDREVLNFANNENRVVVTHDYDFAEIVVRLRQPAVGIVVIDQRAIRTGTTESYRKIAVRMAALAGALYSKLTIVEADRTRQRSIDQPDTSNR